MEIIDLKNTKKRMDERLEMMHKLYPDTKPTNADRIRSMTNEELAEILHNAGGNWYSEEYWLKWLKEEVTDKDGE